MINLSNNCSRSELTVFPKNWLTGGQTLLRKTWRVQYYFRDPSNDELTKKGKLKYPYGKFVSLKKMNKFKTLPERRHATRLLLENETDLLTNFNYNPITGYRTYSIGQNDHEVAPTMPFIPALTKALEEMTCGKQNKMDIKSVLKYVEIAAIKLHYDDLSIAEVQRRHIKALLSAQSAIHLLDADGKPAPRNWTDARYNVYWKHLHRLFEELIEMEAVEYNPVSKISKKSVTTRMRDTLSVEQRREIVNVYLKKNYYTFYRFCQIFFHSGGRITELLRLRVGDVDLVKQKYRTTVLKGKNSHERESTIKDIALPFWTEIMDGAKLTDYVFGRGLIANAKPTSAAQVTRRWKAHVKDKLEIAGDLYSLKHSNLDEIAAILDDEAAQKQAGHTTSKTTESYLPGKEERDHLRLKGVKNEL